MKLNQSLKSVSTKEVLSINGKSKQKKKKQCQKTVNACIKGRFFFDPDLGDRCVCDFRPQAAVDHDNL